MGRRREGPFTVYPRHDSDVLWVRYWIGDDCRRESTGERDRGKADERAAEIWQAAKARAGDPVAQDSIAVPLSRYAGKLLREVKTLGRAPTYYRDLEVDLRLHILPRWKNAGDVTSLDWEQTRIDLHAQGQGWSSVKRIGKHLRMLLRYCMRQGAIVNVPEILSPAHELIDRETTEHDALPRADRDRLIADLKLLGKHRARRIYEVMFFNLFRKSTVQRITPAWLNLKERTIRVPASKAKNSRPRIYWLHSRTLRALKEQMAEGVIALDKPIFGSFDCSRAFWVSCIRLELASETDKRGLTPHHVTRRTAATMLVEAGVSTKDRMAAGGWESVEAAERYDKPKEQVERSKRALLKLR